jgi:1,4-dihydroxy-2-naphthoyl-CoA hydrolase
MSIWTHPPDLAEVNRTVMAAGLAGHLSVKVTDFDSESLTCSMPITEATRQPEGLLNGGASAALAEITGGVAGSFCIDRSTQTVVGQEISVSHLRSGRSGHLRATARPLRLGKRSQVWHIEMRDDDGELIAVSRLTNAVLERRRSHP